LLVFRLRLIGFGDCLGFGYRLGFLGFLNLYRFGFWLGFGVLWLRFYLLLFPP
jgi:hypothetical protein